MNTIARAAVTEYGMSDRIGQFGGDESRLSNETRALIDREVERLVAGAARTINIPPCRPCPDAAAEAPSASAASSAVSSGFRR